MDGMNIVLVYGMHAFSKTLFQALHEEIALFQQYLLHLAITVRNPWVAFVKLISIQGNNNPNRAIRRSRGWNRVGPEDGGRGEGTMQLHCFSKLFGGEILRGLVEIW